MLPWPNYLRRAQHIRVVKSHELYLKEKKHNLCVFVYTHNILNSLQTLNENNNDLLFTDGAQAHYTR